MAYQHLLADARALSDWHCSPTQTPPTPSPPLPSRVTELVSQVAGWEPEPGQRVLVLELSCEGEDDDTAFPPVHYEL